MKLTVKVTKVYGNIVVYPMCEQSRIYAAIAGTKTLTPATLELIEQLGHEVVTIAPARMFWTPKMTWQEAAECIV
jgi:hypothetical protein